ncbi:hypothetical protein MPC1_30005 [Methylocella tundrae]|nr:hypothetical protein MPC1_30005 [Methylocella tundrae]
MLARAALDAPFLSARFPDVTRFSGVVEKSPRCHPCARRRDHHVRAALARERAVLAPPRPCDKTKRRSSMTGDRSIPAMKGS